MDTAGTILVTDPGTLTHDSLSEDLNGDGAGPKPTSQQQNPAGAPQPASQVALPAHGPRSRR